MTRELGGYLGERLGVPIVMADELQKKYLVGARQLLKMFLYAAAVALIYFGVFHFEEPLISFLGATENTQQRIVRMAAIFLSVPAIAYLYGTVTSLFLKLLKFE